MGQRKTAEYSEYSRIFSGIEIFTCSLKMQTYLEDIPAFIL